MTSSRCTATLRSPKSRTRFESSLKAVTNFSDGIRILGVDPGSITTGFGLIESHNGKASYVASGCLRTGKGELPSRLKVIFDGLNKVIKEFRPTELAIENVFVAKNARSAMVLGQARGAAICAAMANDLMVYEYAATEIKKTVVGRGRADKAQVQHMMVATLGLNQIPQVDAADALACAVCHLTQSHGLAAYGSANLKGGWG